MHICNNERPDTNYSTTAPDCYDIYNTAIIKLYLLCPYANGVKKEYHYHHKPIPMKGKKDNSSSLLLPPSCPRCGATMDLNLLESFGSRHIIREDDDEGRSYYCNNPLCPPDEKEQKRRLLPFSWWNSSHHH